MVIGTKQFEYQVVSISDLSVRTKQRERSRLATATEVLVNDEPIQPTDRFWTSLYVRYGFNKSIFKFFNHEEVFNRISEVESQDKMRVCIERDSVAGQNRLLAVSNPAKPTVDHDSLMETLEKYSGRNIRYFNGIVESSHTPQAGANNFELSGDKFNNRFIMSVPIDGYGLPNIYLSLLREICSNGMVGYSRVFRSSLALGRGDAISPIQRALDGFGNDEGYAALRQRFEAATQSWASVYEAHSLHKLLLKLLFRKQVQDESSSLASSQENRSSLIESFHKMTGDVSHLYGLANLDALSVKRQRTLPVACKIYDLLNFVSEVATHHATEEGNRESQAWLGTIISGEYDMESSCDTFDEFQDFFLDRKLNGEIAKDLQ